MSSCRAHRHEAGRVVRDELGEHDARAGVQLRAGRPAGVGIEHPDAPRSVEEDSGHDHEVPVGTEARDACADVAGAQVQSAEDPPRRHVDDARLPVIARGDEAPPVRADVGVSDPAGDRDQALEARPALARAPPRARRRRSPTGRAGAPRRRGGARGRAGRRGASRPASRAESSSAARARSRASPRWTRERLPAAIATTSNTAVAARSARSRRAVRRAVRSSASCAALAVSRKSRSTGWPRPGGRVDQSSADARRAPR